MRVSALVLLAGTAFAATSASASDGLKFGPPPSWVSPQVIPPAKPTDAPVSILLSDQQIRFDADKTTIYSDTAFKIVNAQGLAAGNVSVVWQPATDVVTINKLRIIRGDKLIDVLGGGQTFTVLRRETNLDAATLDGTLTATIQPEGLQVGDIVELTTTTERSDPVLKGHAEAMFAGWNKLPIAQAHAALRWPSGMHVQVRETPNLPPGRKVKNGDATIFEIAAKDVQPIIAPRGAPDRFKIGRLAEATDYSSWSDLTATLEPLYNAASAIPASGPLHEEVEKIRAASTDPKVRAAQALALVQDRVRYVALLMGQGGYVPASAESSWSRRFGDCKAKTALLLGMLHSLGIEAEPVLVQSSVGDMVADRLPMISLFDHVLVRAHIAGKDYWLDGTRTGDRDLDLIAVPDFGWGLPIVANAKLVQMTPAPLTAPNLDRHLTVDASSGIYAPAKFTIEETYRGDAAVALNTAYSTVTAEQRDQALRDEAGEYFDDVAIDKSSTAFDPAKRELHLTVNGTTKLNWKDGWLNVPTSSLAFDPDFTRTPGPNSDAPLAISHPRYIRDVAAVILPKGLAAAQKLKPPVHETLAGVEYGRNEMVSANTLTVESSERSLVPEVPYKDALAATARLRSLAKDNVYINSNLAYRANVRDIDALAKQEPTSFDELLDRGNVYLDSGKFELAIADFSSAIKLDSKSPLALADRGIAYSWLGRFDAADKDLTAAAALNPDDAVVNRGRGLYLQMKGDLKAAMAAYTRSLAVEPSSGFALLHRAGLEMELGQVDAALADVDRGLADDPGSSSMRLMRARIFAYQQKKDDALGDLAIVEKRGTLDADTKMMVGSVYRMLGMTDRSNALLAQSVKESDPDDPRELAKAAMIQFQLGKMDEALAQSAKALAKDPHIPELRVTRANILYLRGDRAGTEAEAKSLTSENPKSEYAFVAAGKIYHRLGRDAEAFKAFDRAIAIDPKPYVYINREQIRPKSDIKARLADLDAALKIEATNSDALAEKSRVLTDSGDFAGALAALDAIPAGNQRETRDQRGFLLAKSGRLDEAKKLFEEARATTTDPGDLNNLCYAKATAGVMLDSALEDCRKALQVAPDSPGIEDSLGFVQLRIGKLDDAIATYSRVLGKSKIAASYLGRAIAYARKGDAANARKDRAAALAEDPNIEKEFAGYGVKFDNAAH